MSEKIINTFQQRRELQNRIATLADTTTESEMLQIVRAIAHDFPADLVLKSLLKALDTSNSQLRGGLAHLATLLPSDEAIPALRNAVADRSRSTQSRLNAVTVLERFLGEEVSPALLGDLENTDEIAFQSLCEAVEEGHRERHIFLEYVVQMREENAEVALIVMDQLGRLPAKDQLDMLRLIAQDDRESVALSALRRLEQLNPEDAGERLAQILYSLQFTLPPDLARQAERSARKLRFNGYGFKPNSSERWRGLIAPAEASGNQTIWFFETPSGDESETPFVSIVVNQATGILQTYGSDKMPLEDLPAPHNKGELMTVPLDGGESIVFVEAPFDYARWLVHTSLEPHWLGEAWQPLFGEYSLYNDMLWQFERPSLPTSLARYFEDSNGQLEQSENNTETVSPSADDLDSSAPSVDEIDDMAAELLQHPAMGGWILHSYLFWNAIRSGFSTENVDSIDLLVQNVLTEMMQWPEYELFIQGLVTGLQCQAAWLHLAGMDKAAEQAHHLATAFNRNPKKPNPFLYRYVRQAIEAQG